ncbi:MAG: prepilin-type N-terminal cleavage/methylation domain-containing protein [Luteolibacter sp.]
MKTNRPQRRGFTLVELLVVIAILAVLAGFATPQLLRQKKKGDLMQATNNIRQVGLALTDFEQEYGSYPDHSTAETVKQNTETQLDLSGTTANDYFRQLIASDICKSETIFYAKTGFTKKPDDVLNTTETALGKGEVGFGYIMNGESGFSTSGSPSRPILAAPLLFPFADGQFDADTYDSNAVIWKVDGSATSVRISTTKQAQLGGGKRLLQTGAGTVWGEEGVATPRIANPLPNK